MALIEVIPLNNPHYRSVVKHLNRAIVNLSHFREAYEKDESSSGECAMFAERLMRVISEAQSIQSDLSAE